MAYYSDLFLPENWKVFLETERSIVGLKKGSKGLAKRVDKGDIFVCYLARLSRWCGVLEVTSDLFVDSSPFSSSPDSDWHKQFPIRFQVKPVVTLKPELAVPTKDPQVWQTLSITREHDPKNRKWGGFFRGSLRTIPDEDGRFLVKLLKEQQTNPNPYPLTAKDKKQLNRTRRVRTLNRGEVEVEVSGHDDEHQEDEDSTTEQHALATVSSTDAGQMESRTSIRYQAKVAEIGVKMGFKIWIPRNDKNRVLEHVAENTHQQFLNELPLNYDDTSLQTIEQIDVLWLKGRSMTRAFEIEHTTAIYSGLLRMADLLALQPNINIRLHIVAPMDKREKVLHQIKRLVFSLLGGGPLYERCSFLPYDRIDELAQIPHLSHMSDTIIDEYAESPEV
ncbi:MAG: hypothetical protein OXI96_10355 [Acidimicrobiaceae bacterium]|nr:hypothetical protein [Acidimicrobiaceae bacterium]